MFTDETRDMVYDVARLPSTLWERAQLYAAPIDPRSTDTLGCYSLALPRAGLTQCVVSPL